MANRNDPTEGIVTACLPVGCPLPSQEKERVVMETTAEWPKWIEQWKRSGLDAVEFARREGLEPKQFYAWCRKLETCSAPVEPRSGPVGAVEPSRPRTAPSAPAWIKIALPNQGLVCVSPRVDATTVACMLAVAVELSAKDIATIGPEPAAQATSRHRRTS
jgi:hypothetical protein